MHNLVASLPFFDVVIANSLVVQILSKVTSCHVIFSTLLPDLRAKCVCCTIWSWGWGFKPYVLPLLARPMLISCWSGGGGSCSTWVFRVVVEVWYCVYVFATSYCCSVCDKWAACRRTSLSSHINGFRWWHAMSCHLIPSSYKLLSIAMHSSSAPPWMCSRLSGWGRPML